MKAAVWVMVVAVLFGFGGAQAASVIDFDDVDASGGPVSGPALSSYLANYGITVSYGTSNISCMIADDRWSYMPGWLHASSDYNVLWNETTDNSPYSFTLNFAVSQSSITFTRPELVAGPHGLIVSPWTADAYDAAGTRLDTVGEGEAGFYGTRAAQDFTLDGPGIVELVIHRDSYNFYAGLNHVAFDNLTITDTAVPEPSTLIVWSLLGFTGFAYGYWRKRRAA